MDLPPADPVKMLDAWMAWERGELTPGRVVADLKTNGIRQVLEDLVARTQPAADA